MMAKVIAPNKEYTGLSAGVAFANGVGETDNTHLLEWFESKGYEVEQLEPEQEEIPVEKMTVPQLKEYATKNEIDLGEASKKEDILKVIQSVQQVPDPGKETEE
ncbi:hypothetical protein [Paenibacillus sp. FSL K6-2524]|uniref:hypothetical protein n=1 Tax=Paenibacillus sp. FSL K6-2524 TaxID=2954516 RepID=UPI0030FA518F